MKKNSKQFIGGPIAKPQQLALRKFSRRDFIRATAGAAAGVTLASGLPAFAAKRNKGLPTPNKSGIQHIVVVMMENRSFDHFLGWLPNADGHQAGLSYADKNGSEFATYPLAPDYQGCGHPGPAHDYAAGRVQYNNGACDGWLR